MSFLDICILGLANVGKTTILKRIFQSVPFTELKAIKPTVAKERSVFSPSWFIETINVLDLAGQQQYLNTHITPANFEHKDAILTVVDVQNLDQLPQVKTYFEKVAALVKTIEVKPYLVFFMHKYDPEKHNILEKNTQAYENLCQDVFRDLEPHIFLTTIYDTSLFEAFSIILSSLKATAE